VIRVDSPGGTLTGSEAIRRAILRHKAKGIPIAVSMANYAASGGYWVATPGDRIFAEPETVTGSIGVYAFVPSFENTLRKYGVDADGVRTTPLSGQPDFLGGFTPEVNAVLQGGVEHNYEVFLKLVADARGKSRNAIDRIAQGQVWDGGTGRQIGLVDQFGDLDDAIAWAAKEAKLEDGKWHAQKIGSKRDPYASLIQRMLGSDAEAENAAAPRDLVGMMTVRQQDLFGRVAGDVERLFTARGVQAYCLECMPFAPAPRGANGVGPLTVLGQLLRD
jgi:protease-4